MAAINTKPARISRSPNHACIGGLKLRMKFEWAKKAASELKGVAVEHFGLTWRRNSLKSLKSCARRV
jgi:hypothetical protein